MVERVESGASRDRSKKQFHRNRTERSPSLADRIAAGPELVPGQFLWVSAGISPAGNGVLRRLASQMQFHSVAAAMSLRSIHLNLRRTPATPEPRDAMDDSQQRGPHLFLSQ